MADGDTTTTYTIVGLTTGPVFGCPDLSWGAGQSLDDARNGDKQELKNGNGDTIAVAYYNNSNELDLTVKIKGTVPTMTRGGVLAVNSVNYILEDWTTSKKSGDFAEIKLKLKKYDSITLSAATIQ